MTPDTMHGIRGPNIRGLTKRSVIGRKSFTHRTDFQSVLHFHHRVV